MTLEEFLRFENEHPERHEFVAGEVYAMTGATLRHSRIVQNLSFRFMQHARGGPCEVHVNDVKLRIGDERVYYPDLLILCTRHSGDTLVVRDPCLVVEVTSPSSARIDRGEKLDGYRRLESLQAYLVIDQRRRRVDRHWRGADGSWRTEDYIVEGDVSVPCIDMSISVDEIYEGVDLPSLSEPEPVEYEV
jgi:Uma2 family endonuclease